MLPRIGTWELLLMLGIVLVIFSPKLPEVGRSLGKTIREFRKSTATADEPEALPKAADKGSVPGNE